MRFADARWSEHVLRAGDEAAGRELARELRVDRWLELELKVGERLHHREVCDLDAHGDELLLLGVGIDKSSSTRSWSRK